MTKRTLYIIIGILVVMDMAAGFWYLAGHINSDGHGVELFSNNQEVTDADTLGGNTSPDRYRTIDDFRYYVSAQPGKPDDALTYYCSVKRVKARLPIQVNGSRDIGDLLTAINNGAFGNNDASVESSVNVFLSNPTFTTNEPIDYKRTTNQPTVREGYGHVESVKIYPAYASANFLTMTIDRQRYDGHQKTENLQFVSYARTAHHLLTFTQIFNADRNDTLLQTINRRITYRNTHGGHHFRHARELPNTLLLRPNGITFIYGPGKIGISAVQVFVPYDELQSTLTTEFRSLMASDNGGYDFDPITFNKK